jgi:hypothetical protein
VVRPWGRQLGVASWGWLQSPFFIVCIIQGHFKKKFSSISMIFSESFSSKYHKERGKVGWPAGGGQLGLDAVSLLHSLNQGHFFLSLFSSISMIFIELFSTKYHGERGRE